MPQGLARMMRVAQRYRRADRADRQACAEALAWRALASERSHTPAHGRRLIRRRRRRIIGALTLALPALLTVGADLGRRAGHMATFDRLHLFGYLATIVASLIFWSVLLYAAARRRGWWSRLCGAIFVTLFGLAFGVQAGFHHFYNIYLSHDGQIYSRSLPGSLVGQLPLGQPQVGLRVAGGVALAVLLLLLARHFVRPRPWARRWLPIPLVPTILVAMTQIPASYRMWQSTTPDIIYFHGLVAIVKERLGKTLHAPEIRVQRRHPEPVPAMTPRPDRPRNVLLVLQESLRFDVVCNGYDPQAESTDPPRCATPFSNRAVPGRYPLNQLRAAASTTAISISNLWSGVPAHLGFETLHRVPLLWEYAAAAGYSGAYWTSQNVMFGSMRLYVQDLPLSHRAVATQLDSKAHYDAGARDALLSDRVIAEWESLEEPFFAVVHYSNVHFPYVFDEAHAPFKPYAFSKAPDDNQAFLNYYRNVAYLSDMAVGRLLEHIRASPSGPRTVILYTADHGESFREHWQLGHTSSLYDEELKVPAWIDAPEGTLSPAERLALEATAEQFASHFDFAPTMLDLLGLWDAPQLAPFRRRMIGRPLTRPGQQKQPFPLNNCSWLWECGFRNWGMMLGPWKIEAREWDNEFHCFNLLDDPLEQRNLGEQACAPLPDLARLSLGPMPFQEWPSRRALLWGPPPASSAAP